MKLPDLRIDNARIIFRNFSGKEGQFNPAGQRNFCVLLETKIAEKLAADGWNIRWLNPRDPDEEKQAYMQVKVEYKNFPPKIVLVTSKNKTVLSEDEIGLLDLAEIKNVDMIINPYPWQLKSGKSGIKAYAKKIFITILEDELESRYSNVPDSALNSMSSDEA